MSINYNFGYNFGEYQSSMKVFFDKITGNSIQYFLRQIKSGKILNGVSSSDDPKFKMEYNKLLSYIKNIEEYLYYYYSKDKINFRNIFNSISKVEVITVLNNEDRGVYGVTYPNSNVIQINPELKGNEELTAEQRTRLYVAHELGHIVNRSWMSQVKSNFENINALNDNQKQLIYEGFSLLDEVTTQNRAEDIAYFYAHKQRPSMKSHRDSRGMYDGEPYKSNFDYYKELQEPATIFSRTLRGIGKIKNDEEALGLLSTRALKPNFVNTIINEYNRDGQTTNLYNEFQFLGIIKNASYARFGHSSENFLNASKLALNKFKNIAIPLLDPREPFEENQL